MVTEEMARAVMIERMQELAALDREHQARAFQRQDELPRSGPSRKRKRFPLLSFMARAFPTASV